MFTVSDIDLLIRRRHIQNSTTASVVIAHFVPIPEQTWPPQAILVSEWPIF